MSDSGPAVGGPLATGQIEGMVTALWPDWQLREAASVGHGDSAVYALTVASDGNRREVVLKACLNEDPAAFRPEPYLLDALGRETEVPVPAVYGTVDDHEAFPSPFFVMERRPGVPPDAASLGAESRERIARDAGRHLGALHSLGTFARFGRLRMRVDVATDGGAGADSGGIPGPDYEITVADDARDAWAPWFREVTDAAVDALDDRFADLEPAIRDRLADAESLLEGQFEPVPTHMGYRFGNLLVDPERGETRAVLDFAGQCTADAEYNLAAVEHALCGWVGLDHDRRERVRAALLDGYRETNALRDDGSLWALYDLYLLATWLPGLAVEEARGAGPAPRDPDYRPDASAETLRQVTRDLLEADQSG